MKPATKYYVAQFIAILTVGIPTVLIGIFGGGLIARLINLTGTLEINAMCIAVGYITSRLTSFATGWFLERFNMLPRGARRIYPHATSWGGYFKVER